MKIVSPFFRLAVVLGLMLAAVWLTPVFGGWLRSGRWDLLLGLPVLLFCLIRLGSWWVRPVPGGRSEIGLGRPEVTGLDGREFTDKDIQEVLQQATHGRPEDDWAWAFSRQEMNGGTGGPLWLDRVRVMRRLLELNPRLQPRIKPLPKRPMAGSAT